MRLRPCRRNGWYYWRGSASPDWLKHIAESLAGRIGMLELTPYLFAEVAKCKGMRLDTLWLGGGFPDALLALSTRRWQARQENHVHTFIERDIARHRLTLTAVEVRRLMTLIAHVHGVVRNASQLGRSLGYS